MSLEGITIFISALPGSIRLTNVDPRDNTTSVPFPRCLCDAIIAGDGGRAERLIEKLLVDTGKRLDERVMVNKN